jgi:hypothetical protein
MPDPPVAAWLVRQSCDLLALPNRVVCTALLFLHRVEATNAVDLVPKVIGIQGICAVKMLRLFTYLSCTSNTMRSHLFLVLQRLAAACIFLAAKVEETNLRTNDMLNAVEGVAAGAANGGGISLSHFCCLVGGDYAAQKQRLILDEQLLLRHLRFDLVVEQPHRHLYILAQCWGASLQALRLAICLLNDAVCCCEAFGSADMPPATAAAAALHVGAQLCGQGLYPHGWWRAVGISDDAMRAACRALLDLLHA